MNYSHEVCEDTLFEALCFTCRTESEAQVHWYCQNKGPGFIMVWYVWWSASVIVSTQSSVDSRVESRISYNMVHLNSISWWKIKFLFVFLFLNVGSQHCLWYRGRRSFDWLWCVGERKTCRINYTIGANKADCHFSRLTNKPPTTTNRRYVWDYT